MIYVDTSVVLAELLAEDRHPDPMFWRQPLVSSRLLEYETWVRLNARGLGPTHGEAAEALLAGIAIVEMSRSVLDRVRHPFPKPVRTLDAIHLASLEFLRDRGVSCPLATFDANQRESAIALGLDVHQL